MTCSGVFNGMGLVLAYGSLSVFLDSNSRLALPVTPTSANDRGNPSSRTKASNKSPRSACSSVRPLAMNTSCTSGIAHRTSQTAACSSAFTSALYLCVAVISTQLVSPWLTPTRQLIQSACIWKARRRWHLTWSQKMANRVARSLEHTVFERYQRVSYSQLRFPPTLAVERVSFCSQ